MRHIIPQDLLNTVWEKVTESYFINKNLEKSILLNVFKIKKLAKHIEEVTGYLVSDFSLLKLNNDVKEKKEIDISENMLAILCNYLEILDIPNIRVQELLEDISNKGFSYKTLYHDSQYINFEIPHEFKVPLQQYLLFFKEFVLISKRKNIEFEIKESDNGVSIKYNKIKYDYVGEIENWSKEYMNFFRDNLKESLPIIKNINIVDQVDSREVEFLRLRLENEILHLKRSLSIIEHENKLLKKDKNFLKRLTITLASKDFQIQNQYISGGEQQFANKINNK